MKLKSKDYISVFYEMLFKRPAENIFKKVRYFVELGGKGGYEVNGIGNYWGRYASIEKIVELAQTIKTDDDCFNFYFPASQYNGKYSHQIGIHRSDTECYVELEFHESSNQCGSYFKKIALENLESEIRNLREVERSPESQGFIYEEW